MHIELKQSIEEFFKLRREELDLETKETELDYQNLDEKVKRNIPYWLNEILITYPLANYQLEFVSKNHVEYNLCFVGFKGINDEYNDFYPGCVISEYGYICIAEDPTGSGNPFFININEGKNPPVYQIIHDVSEIGEVILQQGRILVTDKMSNLFK